MSKDKDFAGFVDMVHTLVGALGQVETQEDVFDQQVGGDHYKKFGDYQPWIVFAKWLSEEELRGLAKGTAIWYLMRQKVSSREDIEKAIHTLQLYLEVSKDKE